MEFVFVYFLFFESKISIFMEKLKNITKKNLGEIDSFDFTSFFELDFLKISNLLCIYCFENNIESTLLLSSSKPVDVIC